MDCIFCKIMNKEIPSYDLYEDDICKVIMDANPNSNGHVLIIPKKHIIDYQEMDNETLSHLHDVAKIIGPKIEKALNPDGLMLHVNYGVPQKVKHYHLHIIPTYHTTDKKIKKIEEVYNQIMNN